MEVLEEEKREGGSHPEPVNLTLPWCLGSFLGSWLRAGMFSSTSEQLPGFPQAGGLGPGPGCTSLGHL